MKRTKIKELLSTTPTGQTVTVKGWVRTFRNNQFVSINDGSTLNNIQAVVALNSVDETILKRITTGSIIQNSARCRVVLEFSARNVGPKV